MMKKIISLTKVFCQDYFENLPAFNKDRNKKNIFFWLIIILNIALGYLSYQIIDFLNKIGQPEIFLSIFLLIFNIIIIIQVIMASTNVFYFSKDLEYILPFPIKPVELLISKFNTILSISYSFEIIFAFIPLLMYGLIAGTSITYYFWLIIILIIFPIFPTLIISTIMLFIMKLSKFVKNKDIFQLIVVTILMIIITLFEMQIFNSIFSKEFLDEQIKNIENIYTQNNTENINIPEENGLNNIPENKENANNFDNNRLAIGIKNANKYLLIINPTIDILVQNNILIKLINIFKLIFLNLIFFIIFIFIGKKTYLKNILKSISKINTKNIKNKKIKNNYKKSEKNKAYILMEFKELIKNPTFFMQCIFPSITFLIIASFLLIVLYPVLIDLLELEEIFNEQKIEFNIEIFVIIIALIQIIFTFSNLSLTAITRKGKNANFIKYIPIKLYNQFIYLNIPQIFINNISIITILIIIKYLEPNISIIYFIALFIIMNLINFINSFLMLIVDLKRPNLNWDNETAAIKQNQNKLFQYVTTILIILFLIYLAKIFSEINFNLSIILLTIILGIILLIINLYVKKNIKKLFKKIY